MAPAIAVENLAKCYRVDHAAADSGYRYRTLRESLARLATRPFRRWRGGTESRAEQFWALRDVSFDVRPGEAVGIIGRNGAGKSTLLKILSRITKPTRGQAKLHGRVGSLLEVGTGFHPELTGRENIYLNGAILGMTRREIARKFDEIVAFAETERFLDTPVKRYSSGMYVRLAFAVAAHLEPEILIVDEVLAVGDAEFQKKCLTKMGHVAGQGRTVLFVSHNMGAVQTLCRRAFLLAHGEMQQEGPARDVVAEYLRVSDAISSLPLSDRKDRSGVGRFKFEELTVLNAQGEESDFAVSGEDMAIRLRLATPAIDAPMPAPLDLAVVIRDYQGNRITELASYFTASSPTTVAGAREVTCFVPHLPLLAGQYRLELWCATSSETQDMLEDAAILRVEPGNYFGNTKDVRLPRAEKHGCIMIPQRWGG